MSGVVFGTLFDHNQNCNIICSIANEFDQYYFDFAAASYIDMSAYLASFNWNTILDVDDVDVDVDYFYYIIDSACQLYVPLKRKSPKSYPEWFNSDIISLY